MVLTMKCVPLVPKYNLICCSCNLKTGTAVIATLALITELIQSLEAFTSLCYYKQEKYEMRYMEINLESREFYVGRFTSGILHSLTAGLLLYGVWKDKPIFMVPFVLTQYLILLFLALVIIIVTIVLVILGAVGWAVLVVIVGGFVLLISTYLWAGVYTYYRQLEDLDTLVPDNLLPSIPHEEETAINTEDLQKTYTQLERNIQQNYPQAV
ncbi:uncharacterized protein [Periplaneta americana]|uniref:uncharacterized protein n=1 Tax=Periplaneta americana TaxID=6978 RepID=UPI0037E86B57